jgi:predicted amidohydrolase
VRAAAVQLTSTGDLDANLASADRLTRAAARDGAELVVLPEKWPALGPPDVVAAAAQDPHDGPAVRWATATARELGIDLVAGSMTLAGADGRLRNTALHVAPDGTVAAAYAKLHLFDVEVDGTVYRESDLETAGDEPVVSGDGIGLAICYDLRFPTLFEELQRRGATLFAVPSAFTLATTRDHWDVLVRARAIEQQAFVVAANQVGEHAPGLRSGGRSCIVDPWGVVLATAPDTEAHVVADLDLAHQRRIRARLPALRHRRSGVAAA